MAGWKFSYALDGQKDGWLWSPLPFNLASPKFRP